MPFTYFCQAVSFTAALADLKQIPAGTSASVKAQEKTQEYREKQTIRAISQLQQAYDRAILHDFSAALIYLKQIPKSTPVYAKAQEKIKEYAEKQRIQLVGSLPTSQNSAVTPIRPSIVAVAQDLNPGSYLREIG